MDESRARISKISRELNKLILRTMKLTDVGPSEIDLIHVVRKHDGISQIEISQILGTDKSAVNRQVSNLVLKGYLRKEINPEDGRSFLIYKTDKADELKNIKRHIENTFYEYILGVLTDDERKTFVKLLNKVYEKSKEESKNDFNNVKKML